MTIGAFSFDVSVDSEAVLRPLDVPSCFPPALDCNPDASFSDSFDCSLSPPVPDADPDPLRAVSRIACVSPNGGLLAYGRTVTLAVVHYDAGPGASEITLENAEVDDGALIELMSCNPVVTIVGGCGTATVSFGDATATPTEAPCEVFTCTPLPTFTPSCAPATCTPTATNTPTATSTPCFVPVCTVTPTATSVPTDTLTPSATATSPSTATDTPTAVPTVCPAGSGGCASGFWSGTFDNAALGECSFALTQVGTFHASDPVTGTASCTTAGAGVVNGRYRSLQGALNVSVQFASPAYVLGVNGARSGDTIAGTWTCTCGFGSLSISRSASQTSSAITAASGGTLTTALGDDLTVPAGALASDTTLTSTLQPVPAVPPVGLVAISRAYDFGPDGTTFSSPVAAVFHYTTADLAGGLVDPLTLRVYVFDSLAGDWVLVGGTVDTLTQTITVDLNHFSDYALFANMPVAIDADGDAVTNAVDDCVAVFNPVQANADANFVNQHPLFAVDDTTVANSDAAGDACDSDDDNDGLPDTDESGLTAVQAVCPQATGATSPVLADSDGDRVGDGAECALGSDPASAGSKPATPAPGTDADGDGLSDAYEGGVGSNANAKDTDGDGLQDGWEVKGYNTSPAIDDGDGDGVRDGCEVASINSDAVVNPGDQALLSAELARAVPQSQKLANFDLNKDGAINPGDQAFQASKVGVGKCP